jgi:two-component system sensor histidine kinase ChvG
LERFIGLKPSPSTAAKSDAEPVDMSALLEAVVSLANDIRKPDEPRIALDIRRPPARRKAAGGSGKPSNAGAAAPFMVLGHDSRLGQVFTNLLDNARSFAPTGSSIAITLEQDDQMVTVKVEDEGPGIPDHALERIFERFYTDRPSEHGFGQNSGLGLSISRQIVEAHRGTITAANREGGGACFSVRSNI